MSTICLFCSRSLQRLLPRFVELDHAFGPTGRALELADEIKGKLGPVLPLGNRVPQVGEELRQIGGRPTVDSPPTGKEDHLIQQSKDSVTGLVYRHNYDTATGRNPLQHLHHQVSARGVQPRRRLVEKQQDRVVDYVRPDRHAPPLPAGDAAVALVADDGVGRVPEAQLVDEGLHAEFLFGLGEGPREAELRREREGFLHREHREEEVVLHHVGGDHLHQSRLYRLAVERDGAF